MKNERTSVQLEKLLKGKIVYVDHPATVLNPNGRDGFIISQVQVDRDGSIAVRAEDTMWFGISCVRKIEDVKEQRA